MTFGTAVSSVLTQYTGFSGRARRSEFWWYTLFAFVVYLVVALVDAVLNTTLLGLIVSLGLLLPTLAVTVRRLHDTGRSGWWILISLIPLVGAIVLLVFECSDSEPGPNRFGPSPKPDAAGHEWAQQSPTAPPAWS
jgi:uncharacterized membrane protein YhaH (DUF805 family)